MNLEMEVLEQNNTWKLVTLTTWPLGASEYI